MKELIGKSPIWNTVADMMEPMHTMQDAEKEAFAKELVKKIRAEEITAKENPDGK